MAPGSTSGTIILVGHVNNGGVRGAFADLADYRVGQVITLVLADGRRLKYAVAALPIEVNKDKLGPRREELFQLFEHLEGELTRTGFMFPPDKRDHMQRTIRATIHRARLTYQEVQTLRGMIVALAKGKHRGPPKE